MNQRRKLKLFEYPREDGESILVAAPTFKDAVLAVGPEATPLSTERAAALIASAYMVEVVGLKRRKGDTAEAKDFLNFAERTAD